MVLKLHTYDDVVERVALHIDLDDPAKIRLTSHNCYSQQPIPQPIKYRGPDHLTDLLIHYNQPLRDSLIYFSLILGMLVVLRGSGRTVVECARSIDWRLMHEVFRTSPIDALFTHPLPKNGNNPKKKKKQSPLMYPFVRPKLIV
ncbi:hypothetical protein Droror1_Dr00003206 [Drosera rotundifolia]